MINIAICDDDKQQIFNLKKNIVDIFKKLDKDVNIKVFNDGNKLINFYLSKENYFDIVFLDIIMPETNGVEVAKKIRAYDAFVNIVMVTVSNQYLLDGYDFNAYAYILKPYEYEEIEKVTTKLISKINCEKEKNICITNKNNIYKLKITKIMYLESILRKVKIKCSEKNEYELYTKLDELEEKLEKSDFIRCHRSFLVNMNYIASIENNELILLNGEHIPISKKYINKVKSLFIDFIDDTLNGMCV